MKRVFIVLSLLVVGGFSLAVIVVVEPLLMILRPPAHYPRASDLELDEITPPAET